MKKKIFVSAMSLLVALGAWLDSGSSAPAVHAVADAAARELRGGACDKDYAQGVIPCPAGSILCAGGAQDCENVDLDTLVEAGAGTEEVKRDPLTACIVCGGTTCTTTEIITETGVCASS